MPRIPTFSLIVPTRQRTVQLRRMLESVAATAADAGALEVVLVVDEDDPVSRDFVFDALTLQKVVVPPGLPMGALNMAGYEASTGAYLMLLNDDVIARTRRWDRRVLSCLHRFRDGIVLVHVNDQLFGEQLCAFPIVSRGFCVLAGAICPRGYLRYRIDDHIEDIFNLLWMLGECRTVYLVDVVFEHLNYVQEENGRTYVPDPAALAQDARLFDELFRERKELALRLMSRIAGHATPEQIHSWRASLDVTKDPFALRVPERHRVECAARKLRHHVTARLRRISLWTCQAAIRALQRTSNLPRSAPGSPAGTTSATAPDRRAS